MKLCYIDTDNFIVHVKQKIFMKALQKKDHYQKEKTKK